MIEFEIQQIYGKAEAFSLKISLSAKLVLYRNESQIAGDEKTVAVDDSGDWSTELVDTDNMPPGTYYNFEINGRIYRKLVPVNAPGWNFNDLPDFIF